jgi:NhaP-type Na+/H+ or K+/H+ antiporter
MALSASIVKRLPLSTSMLYLGAGVLIGPRVLNLAHFDPIEQSEIIERITEIVVIVSLFSAGLKLRVPLRDPLWRLPIVLASWSMMLTVGLISLVGRRCVPIAARRRNLLGAVLAPTDPVLASDVQVTGPRDRDRLRFTLTGEAGSQRWNGVSFRDAWDWDCSGCMKPGMVVGAGWPSTWLWAIPGGFLIGGLLGTGAGRIILYLRREHKEALELDDFLALGLIALSYGVALLLHTYGFLAVFAAGLALRKIEERAVGPEKAPDEVVAKAAAEGRGEEIATHPETAPRIWRRPCSASRSNWSGSARSWSCFSSES